MEPTDKLKVAGDMQINGAQDESQLYVYITEGGLHIINAGRCAVWIYPLTKKVAVCGDFRSISQPTNFKFEGTCLGLAHKTFGGNSELETYSRNITNVDLSINHSAQEIAYEISGLAKTPKNIEVPKWAGPPGDWQFEISFTVARKDIAFLYGLNQQAAEAYLNQMDTL
jgi:hypothetical protein